MKTLTQLEQNLFLAASQGNTRQIEQLIRLGVSVEARDEMGNTPLFNAAKAGYIDATKALIKGGADVVAYNKFNQTPHMWAEFFHNYHVCRVIEGCIVPPKEPTLVTKSALDAKPYMDKNRQR